MFKFLSGLSAEGWLTFISVIAAALWKPAELLFKMARSIARSGAEADAKLAEIDADREQRDQDRRQDRVHELEALADSLRRALDKNLVRENSVVTAAELLVGIAEMVEMPTPGMKAARLRAIEILEMARHLNGSSGQSQ